MDEEIFMYSPTTRLLTILELLQSHHRMRGGEIARRLEVSVRTVRRYIVMLQDMGIPIEAERGQDGAYYLGRGYKLPPLMFNNDEAIGVVLGLLMLRANQFPVNPVAIEGTLAKVERVMPEILLEQVRGLQTAITFSQPNHPSLVQADFVSVLSGAIQTSNSVLLVYQAFDGHQTERIFNPYGIVYHLGYWYTAGFCHLRKDLRTFRLDRVVTLKKIEQSFEKPSEFDTLQNVLDSLATMSGVYTVEILLHATIEQVRQVLLPTAGIFEETTAGIIWRRETHDLNWIGYLILQFDFPISIHQPKELRDLMQHLANKAMSIAEDSTGI
jgi:predicted DNA-binding transcriptional regulator YafY